ncbi:GNAT family N-acetyltransferase [Solibacillus sp. R5-41]|nr:GNAT family N-acetyltransferase [Solibacillus sp. R5-41]
MELLSMNEWQFHSNPQIKAATIKKSIENGYYSDGRETFWIVDNKQKVGVIIIDDIDDTIPLIDIRLTSNQRGKGIGVKALQWLQEYLFGVRGKIRIEGYTRADNLAMRKCFSNAGFVKEGYLRNAWENEDGTLFDSVLYAAIFEDWKNNVDTQTKINDLPY